MFVTKYRRGALTSTILDHCESAMRKVCNDFGVDLREFEGEDDHVHLLIGFPPTVQLSRLVNSLKGVSSRHLRRWHAEHLEDYLLGRCALVTVLLLRDSRRCPAGRDRRLRAIAADRPS